MPRPFELTEGYRRRVRDRVAKLPKGKTFKAVMLCRHGGVASKLAAGSLNEIIGALRERGQRVPVDVSFDSCRFERSGHGIREADLIVPNLREDARAYLEVARPALRKLSPDRDVEFFFHPLAKRLNTGRVNQDHGEFLIKLLDRLAGG